MSSRKESIGGMFVILFAIVGIALFFVTTNLTLNDVGTVLISMFVFSTIIGLLSKKLRRYHG
ncbi:hypothetical protein AYK24_00025 [Thermoplasmatales archaeon SG8-52-4]|nr:MAG: hypothetical protein AYK24_00025 [Thermoplasmatales archaeon SG8-52-4]